MWIQILDFLFGRFFFWSCSLRWRKKKTKFEIKQIIGNHFFFPEKKCLHTIFVLDCEMHVFPSVQINVPKTVFRATTWWKVSMKVVYLVQTQLYVAETICRNCWFWSMSICNLYLSMTGFFRHVDHRHENSWIFFAMLKFSIVIGHSQFKYLAIPNNKRFEIRVSLWYATTSNTGWTKENSEKAATSAMISSPHSQKRKQQHTCSVSFKWT